MKSLLLGAMVLVFTGCNEATGPYAIPKVPQPAKVQPLKPVAAPKPVQALQVKPVKAPSNVRAFEVRPAPGPKPVQPYQAKAQPAKPLAPGGTPMRSADPRHAAAHQLLQQQK